MKNRIILASASPRRLQLLKQCGLRFVVCPSNIEETTKYKTPELIVKDLALRKARSVAEKFKQGFVIGADTIVVLKGKIIGKPDSKAHAFEILKSLSGSYHKVYTGIVVVNAFNKKYKADVEVSKVKMRKFSIEELKNLAGKHMDKAGAYAVQEEEDKFVEKIEGDYYNVVGLPLKKLASVMRFFDLRLPKYKNMY